MTNPVPWLRSGVGDNPSEGGCIMQVIDWISTGGWTDRPECVHPVLRALAIKVNDVSDDEGRQRLLELAPRLMGTNNGDRELLLDMATWCARRVLRIYEERYPNDDRPRKAIEAVERRDTNASASASAADAAYAASYAAYAAADAASYAAYAAADAATDAAAAAAYASAYYVAYAVPAASYAAYAAADAYYAAAAASSAWSMLLDALDEYDRLSGRGIVEGAIDWTPVCEVMA